MELQISDGAFVALVAAIGGVALGLAARLGRFCTLGAIEDLLYGGSDHRIRMWGIALGTAMIATFGLIGAGFIPAADIPYLGSGWNPIAHVIGGLLFGYGMAIAGNCGFGALARLGGGDLRSFVIVLVMGIAGYIVMSGPLAALRVRMFPADLLTSDITPGLAHLAEALTGIGAPVFGVLAGAAIMIMALGSQSFRAERGLIVWGHIVGLAIAFAWAGTHVAAQRSFGATPLESYTFVAPLGETILYVMTASGTTLSFAVGSVGGVLAGAFIGSLIKGHFRWEACEDPRELRRQITGAALMGAGAILAMGCSVGQGLSAMSVLAYGAPLTLAAIFAGAALGLRQLITGWASV